MPYSRRKLVVNEPRLVRPISPADLRHRVVGRAQQRRRPLHPSGQQVLVRRLAEHPPELAGEVVVGGDVCDARQCRDVERLAVARVDHVAGAQQVAAGGDHALAPSHRRALQRRRRYARWRGSKDAGASGDRCLGLAMARAAWAQSGIRHDFDPWLHPDNAVPGVTPRPTANSRRSTGMRTRLPRSSRRSSHSRR